jgi:hypothetical protein
MSKEEIERMDLNMLAMYCQRVAEVREVNSMEAFHARQLKHEWVSFIGFINPSSRTEHEMGVQAEQLRQRMLSFLSTVELPSFLRQVIPVTPTSEFQAFDWFEHSSLQTERLQSQSVKLSS